jgi:hypothetical protein
LSTDTLIAIELLLVLALVLGFGIRELRSLKRDREREAADSKDRTDGGSD